MPMMQKMVPGVKLIERPTAKEALFGLVHLDVYFVPKVMMQADNYLKRDRGLHRHYRNDGADRQCF
jgi:hypothetical protein